MKRLTRWIIHKLGGLTFADLPMDIAQQLLNYWANKTIDYHSESILRQGFKDSERREYEQWKSKQQTHPPYNE